jgi:hypothetical protein
VDLRPATLPLPDYGRVARNLEVSMQNRSTPQLIADTLEFWRAAGISYRAPFTLFARMSSDQRRLHGARKEGWLA